MLKQNLQKYFNFSQFRPGQEEIVQTIIDGRDVVALMPTGGGKSLCYQLPAVMHGRISIIISPLIALMKDQVDALNARGISATFINSSLDPDEVEKRMRDISEGRTKILYVAPERFSSSHFEDFFRGLDVGLFAVDEAHCVSQWGHDFRPDYLEIKRYIKLLKHRPVVAAFTATATPEVKDDIIERLELQKPEVFIRGFDRPNLKFFVEADLGKQERADEVLRLARTIAGFGIVYTLTRRDAESIASFLSDSGIQAVYYHAGMDQEERKRVQNDFMAGRYKAVVATIAFGMGIDKTDVRFVVHSGMPGSLEGYYQEAGRAGRDGKDAYCILLHSKKDVSTHEYFIRIGREQMLDQGKGWDEIGEITRIKNKRLDAMVEYVMTRGCRRNVILRYFNDPEYGNHKTNCRGCDICLKWKNGSEKKTLKIGRKKYRYEEIRTDYPMAYERWNSEDDETLKTEYYGNKSTEALSELFKRKTGAIRSRLKKLGLVND